MLELQFGLTINEFVGYKFVFINYSIDDNKNIKLFSSFLFVSYCGLLNW